VIRIELPRTLEGWDDSRPLVLALFEAPEISITALLALTDQADPPEQLSHRIVIPATDPALLAQSLTEVARLTGCIDVPAPLAESFGSASAVVVCDDVFAVLETGEVDLVIAVYLNAAEGLRTETLVVDDYVCLVRRGHLLAKRKRVRVDDYQAHAHVAYTPVGFVPHPMSEAVPGIASASGIRASVPYLLALPDVVRRTDLVATVPRRLLSAPIDLDSLVTLEAPKELPGVEHSQWWHPRFDSDPAHQWLREQVRAALAPA